jgi:hypothetical protein
VSRTTRNVVVVVPLLFDTVKWYTPDRTDLATLSDSVIDVAVDLTILIAIPFVAVATDPPFKPVP